jgi:hypothetical protein
MNQAFLANAVAAVMPSAKATGLFTSLCDIEAPTPASGAISGTYTAVTGLQALPCMDAPEPIPIAATEVKSALEVQSLSVRRVLLDKYYPALAPGTNWGSIGWRAVIDGVQYDLLGAGTDSQRQTTYLKCRKVTV